MSWIEYHIEISADNALAISDKLTELGAEALTFYDAGDQPIYEPELNKAPAIWKEAVLVALFDKADDSKPILDFLQTSQVQGILKQYNTKELPCEDWVRRSLENFKPISFGKRLWVCPSWETPPDPHAVNIILDPGLAFGTGTHPTTALCLEWLDAHFKTGSTVIDYGCGSGILALAACKLGGAFVTAVDHDPQALFATEENARRNSISTTQLITHAASNFASNPVDLLIANILTNPLLELTSTFIKLIKKRGKIVLSGILINQTEQIMDSYSPYFDLEVPVFKQDWVRITGSKK